MKRTIALLLTACMLLTLCLSGCGGEPPKEDEPMTIPLPETKAEKLLKTLSADAPDYHLQLAALAVDDLIANFWEGDNVTGKLRPVFKGYPKNLLDERGQIWEAAEVLFNIYDLWVLTGEESYRQYMVAEANYFRDVFKADELEQAGVAPFHTSNDDCAWNAMLFCCFYRVTGDWWFVERAIRLLDNAYDRWHDSELGGGLWYNDTHGSKALYETGIALTWLRLWEITGEQRFYDLALESYEWMHTALGRDDGIYYCEADQNGPKGDGKVQESHSCSFLGGNMAMAALSAKFYKLTGEQKYLDRVYATNEGILKWYNNDGVLLNDRDAWTNGTFASYYASEVLSLPNTEAMQKLVKDTAISIIQNDRTADGYYGGSWQGPADGGSSIWASAGSSAFQTMTSGTTVAIVVSAAILEAGINDYIR